MSHRRARFRAKWFVAGCALSLLAVAATLHAQTFDASRRCDEPRLADPGRTHLLSFQLENDLFAGTDAQYTNGVKLTWVSPNISDFNDPLLPAWIRCSNEAVRHLVAWFLPNDASVRNMVVTLGQAMYTPVDRDRTTIDPQDRPYAGWTYLGLGYNVRFDAIGRAPVLDTVEVDLGIVGPHAYAKQTQDFVHRVRGLPRFRGWGNELRDEPGLQVVWERKHRPPSMELTSSVAAQAIPHYGVSIGNVASYANAGIEFRAGWRLPDDFGTSPIRPGGDNAAPRATTAGGRLYNVASVHVFASFDGRLVANNIFLDGNTFAKSYAIKKRRLVGDIAYGWAYTWPSVAGLPSGKLAYAHYVQSREFEGEGRNHGFGSVTVSLEF